jgi:L-threonylcarbamoyladenylate synthase
VERYIFLPTDTIYGISCSVDDVKSYERIHALKGTAIDKPLIVLIPNMDSLLQFGVVLTAYHAQLLQKIWPGPYSVMLPFVSEKYGYISNTGSIVFRVPDTPEVRSFLHTIGPVFSTSANKTGERPATTVGEAMSIFGDAIDVYIDGGVCNDEPSTLIKVLR